MRIQFGEELEVLQNGPLIDPKTLRGMGVSDGTTCWGVWMTGQSDSRNPVKKRKELEIPHLMVSPLHPSVWPISFQLRVMLRDEDKSPSHFLSAIEHIPIEIQFSEYSFVGYEQMELNLLCTFSDLAEWKTEFLTFYAENIKDSGDSEKLHGLWASKAKKQKAKELDAIGDIEKVLRISGAKLKEWMDDNNHKISNKTGNYDHDSIRRTALEWIGRRMLRRLTAMWATVWWAHYGNYERPETEIIINPKRNLDPEGDYFFSGKSVELGRKPWNIELPITASWEPENSLVDIKKNKKLPSREKLLALWRKKNQSWFPPEVKTKTKNEQPSEKHWIQYAEEKHSNLHKRVKNSRDLAYQRRTKKPRITKDALLARCSKDENEWINNVRERILIRNWLHPYTCLLYTSPSPRDRQKSRMPSSA